MNYLSVCSGIEAATVAWHDMGWNPVAFSEIEKFPSEVLSYHYPTVPNLGDMTKFKEWNLNDSIGLLVGGTPCQSFSVAGLRKGLEDPRGNLALIYCGILDKFKPKWFLWENVPGVLSSGGGRDFGSFLGAVAELGYGFAYRVLDAQYFGVAQRRRRVFVVGYLGDWRPAAKVLFESESLCRDNPPSRGKREKVANLIAPSVANCLQTTCNDYSKADGFNMITHVYETHPADSRVKEMGDVCQTVTSRWGTGGGNVPIALAENTIGRQPHNGGNGDGFTEDGPMYTLNATGVHGVAIPINTMTCQGRPSDNGRMGLGIGKDGDPCPTLTEAHSHAVAFQQNTRNEVRYINGDGQIAGALMAEPGMKQQNYVMQSYGFEPGIAKREGEPSRFVEEMAPTLRAGMGDNQTAVAITPFDTTQITSPQNYSNPKAGDPCHPLAASAHVPTIAYSFDSLASNSMKSKNPNSGCREVELSKTLDTSSPCPSKNQGGIGIVQAIGVDTYNGTESGDVAVTMTADMGGPTHSGLKVMQRLPIAWDAELNAKEDKMGTLIRGGQGGRSDGVMMPNMAVRRLTPIECERLQGFPDNYTDIKPKGKPTPDGSRYKALGNSMAVPVMKWIGERINQYERGEL
jgi:DNA (cytosine-5)-methyltransferase 1